MLDGGCGRVSACALALIQKDYYTMPLVEGQRLSLRTQKSSGLCLEWLKRTRDASVEHSFFVATRRIAATNLPVRLNGLWQREPSARKFISEQPATLVFKCFKYTVEKSHPARAGREYTCSLTDLTDDLPQRDRTPRGMRNVPSSDLLTAPSY